MEATQIDTTEIIENEPQISLEIKDEEVIDKSIQSGKQKKPRTEKQIEAFEKARKTRAENVKKRAEDKKINTKPVGRPKKVELVPPVLEDQNQLHYSNNIVESSEEEEIVYKKKPKSKPKKIVKKKKKKVVYVSESSSSEEESSSSEEEEVIVKQLTKPKKSKSVYYEEEQQYSYKPPSLTDFYRVM